MLTNSEAYFSVVDAIKHDIRRAQYHTMLNANRELIQLYWKIGCIINEHSTWGSKFIEKLACDIKSDFPEMTGFSTRNLKYMAKFARTYPDPQIVQAPLAQITWYHNIALMDKLESHAEALWYAQQTVENGWSRNVLVHQIESGLYKRQVHTQKLSNFQQRLPAPQSELAISTMKDPYVFDFISMKPDMQERDIEAALVRNVTSLLLELGKGFAFLGNQYHLEVGERISTLTCCFTILTCAVLLSSS